MAIQAPQRIQLGEHNVAEIIHSPWGGTEEEPGEAKGLIFHHRNPVTGGDCQGLVMFRGGRASTPHHVMEPGPEWDILQEKPLSIRPSVHCQICGTHGWIDKGIWVDNLP